MTQIVHLRKYGRSDERIRPLLTATAEAKCLEDADNVPVSGLIVNHHRGLRGATRTLGELCHYNV